MGNSWLASLFANPYLPPLYAIAASVFIFAIRTSPFVIAQLILARKARYDERHGDWTRLREEVARVWDRFKEQEDENEKCHRELRIVNAKLDQEIAARIQAQAMLSAEGRIKQAEAIAQAEVRLDSIDKEKREDK